MTTSATNRTTHSKDRVMKKATIYTGTGDSGETSLIGNVRVRKNHPRVEAYGTLDELNAHLGLLCVAVEEHGTKAFIEQIENGIITLGSYLATGKECQCPIGKEEIETLENAIDVLEAELPPMHAFILPGGNEAAARANLCRTVCRRAERAIVTLGENCAVDAKAMVFINRLSDYLFLLQRKLTDGAEKKWQKPCR